MTYKLHEIRIIYEMSVYRYTCRTVWFSEAMICLIKSDTKSGKEFPEYGFRSVSDTFFKEKANKKFRVGGKT